jgi:hypothetical protein
VSAGKKKNQGLLVGHFYITLNLEVRRQYVITWLLSLVGYGEEPLSQDGEKSQTISNLACLMFGLTHLGRQINEW